MDARSTLREPGWGPVTVWAGKGCWRNAGDIPKAISAMSSRAKRKSSSCCGAACMSSGEAMAGCSIVTRFPVRSGCVPRGFARTWSISTGMSRKASISTFLRPPCRRQPFGISTSTRTASGCAMKAAFAIRWWSRSPGRFAPRWSMRRQPEGCGLRPLPRRLERTSCGNTRTSIRRRSRCRLPEVHWMADACDGSRSSLTLISAKTSPSRRSRGRPASARSTSRAPSRLRRGSHRIDS